MPARSVLRSLTTAYITGRITLFHAVAHIEFNAIDLALDVTSRFVDQNPIEHLYKDLLGFAYDEFRPFFTVKQPYHMTRRFL